MCGRLSHVTPKYRAGMELFLDFLPEVKCHLGIDDDLMPMHASEPQKHEVCRRTFHDATILDASDRCGIIPGNLFTSPSHGSESPESCFEFTPSFEELMEDRYI